MSYLSLVTDLPGQIGDNPRRPKLITSATYSQVTTAGFLNSSNLEGQVILNTDIIDCWYGAVSAGPSGAIVSPGTYAVFIPTISDGVITLTEWANPGNVLLPVTSGDFAVFNGTSGQIKDAGYLPTNAAKTKVVMANGTVVSGNIAVYTDTAGTIGENAATAINGGNIQAGLSGTAGTLASFPSTASKGSLVVAAVANSGNTTTTISNASMGQASVISIPDPGASTANFLLNSGTNTMASGSTIVLAKANGTEASNAVTASGNAGVITTSSLTVTAGSTYAITWTNTNISSTSVIGLTWMGGTNTNANFTMSATAGTNSSTLTIHNNSGATSISGTILIGYTVF